MPSSRQCQSLHVFLVIPGETQFSVKSRSLLTKCAHCYELQPPQQLGSISHLCKRPPWYALKIPDATPAANKTGLESDLAKKITDTMAQASRFNLDAAARAFYNGASSESARQNYTFLYEALVSLQAADFPCPSYTDWQD